MTCILACSYAKYLICVEYYFFLSWQFQWIVFNLLCVAISVDNGKITKCRLIIMISFQSENIEWARSVKLGEGGGGGVGFCGRLKVRKLLFIFLITAKIWSDPHPPFPSEQQNGFTSALLQWILSPIPKQWTIFSRVNLSLSTSM